MKLLKVKAALKKKKKFISLFGLAPRVKSREVKVRDGRKIKRRVKIFLSQSERLMSVEKALNWQESFTGVAGKNPPKQSPSGSQSVLVFLCFHRFLLMERSRGEEKRVRVSRRDEGNPRRHQELVYISWAVKWRSWMPLVCAALELLSFRRRTRYIS